MSIVKRTRALFAGLTVLIHPSVYHGVREQQDKLLGILLDDEATIVQSDTRSRIDIVLVDIGAYDPEHQELRYVDILDYTWVELSARRQCLVDRAPFKFRPAASTPCNTRIFDPNVFYFVHGVQGYSGLLRNLRNWGACLCTNATEADIILTYATQCPDAAIDCSKLTAKIVDFAWADLCIRSQRRLPYEDFVVKSADSTKFDPVPIVVDNNMSEVDELMDDDDDPSPANLDDKPALDDRTLPSSGDTRSSTPSKATSSKPAYLPVPSEALLKHLDRSKRSHGVKWTKELIDFVVEYYRAAWGSDPRRASKHIAAEIASKLPVSERSVLMWMERSNRSGGPTAGFKPRLPSQSVPPRARSNTTQPVLRNPSRASNTSTAPPPSSSVSSRLSKCGTELPAPQLPVTVSKITCHSPSQGAVAHRFFEELLEWELVRDPDVGIYTICRRVDKTQVVRASAFIPVVSDRAHHVPTS
ncbi:hypothetical protein EXIGLDRAFT_241617 [Exidia glandulosa HHB12029]|uniref:BRCT domain-containing protein n=1 Tax=Exidia glandulosa HHB12029 TaxID=1314781 RepID=A0A165Q725_EXIGL|nr:hypothetical protein EXIGLDRAFT_241617 [Exidia glandulosa HHB12029]